MMNMELRFKDVTFDKAVDENGTECYWYAEINDQLICTELTKKACVKKAREVIRRMKAEVQADTEIIEDTDTCSEVEVETEETKQELPIEAVEDVVQVPEAKQETEEIEVVVESTAKDPEIDTWLLGYIPKKHHAAITKLVKDDDGYYAEIGNGYTIKDGEGESQTIREAKWKEFLKSFKRIEKAA